MQTSVPVLIGAFCLSLDGSITRWHFNGSIDEARIYNRALDKDEIEELFLSTGLVGYWSFNEDSESVAVDNSGNMNNGIIFNASHVKDTPSGLGYALAFNRSDKTYVQTPVYQMSIQTISLWFKMHPNQLGGPIASSHIRDDNHGNFILNAKYADECGMIVRAIDGWDPPNLCAGLGPDEYADSTWHYAAFVSNIGDHSLYIDGELKDTYSGSALTDQRIIYFGLNAPDQIGSDYWYDGILDEVRVYNRALSEIEIFAQYEKYSTQENTMGLISFQNPVVCGEEFDINIYIDPCEEIGGWEIFQLNFTQGLVNANKVLPGSSWITNFDNGTIENEIGMITNIQAWTTGPYPDTNHTACTIQFKAIQPGECYIELSHVIVTDSDFEIIDTNTKHLTLNIISLPAISEEYPSNQTIGLGYCGEDANRPPECIGALVNDADGDELYVKIQWLNHGEEWTTLQSFFNVSNGTYIWAHVTDDDWLWGNTTYEWSIHVFDGRFWVNKTFWYHTGGNRYDVTNDCIVNFIDAGKIWVHRTSQTTYDGLYDVNRDGNVNFIDAGLTWVNRD